VVLVDIPAFDELLLRHQIKRLLVVDPAGPCSASSSPA
jgi:hypothetical protein